ncbi:MAG: T9SS type A sorting domain-containing protein [Flavobacteriales bacterium]
MKLMQFPCTFGTTWSDSFSCGYTVAGTTYTTTGSINANASGYGVLVLPYGAITNVLRVDVTETSNFSVGGQPVTLSQTTQFFWRPGTGNYIAKNLVLSEVINGTPVPLDEEINYLAQGSIGMDEMLRQDIGISVSPNPTNDHAQITFGAQGDIAVAVFDAQGREVSSVRLGQHAPGIHQHLLDLSGLMDGVYTVVLTNDQGERGQQRVVLQR